MPGTVIQKVCASEAKRPYIKDHIWLLLMLSSKANAREIYFYNFF